MLLCGFLYVNVGNFSVYFRVVMVCKLSLKQSDLCAYFNVMVIIFAGSIC